MPVVSGAPGNKVQPGGNTPLSYFQLFVSDSLINLLVEETNWYASQWLEVAERHLPPHSYLALWTELSAAEMNVFIALLITMGVVVKPEMRHHWLRDCVGDSVLWHVLEPQ